jgi:ubiquilin
MPEQLAQMMNSPMLQSVLQNPQVMQNMMANNPSIRQARLLPAPLPAPPARSRGAPRGPALTRARGAQLMEANPEFAQVLNNPQVLRESLQMAANPVRARPRPPPARSAVRAARAEPRPPGRRRCCGSTCATPTGR